MLRRLSHVEDARDDVDHSLGVPVTWILGVDGELPHVGEGLVAVGRGLREAAGVGGQVQRALVSAHVRAHQTFCRGGGKKKAKHIISEATQTQTGQLTSSRGGSK